MTKVYLNKELQRDFILSTPRLTEKRESIINCQIAIINFICFANQSSVFTNCSSITESFIAV